MGEKRTDQMLGEIKSYLRIKDYYEILGIPKNAEEPQIKNAYRKLALRFHPDKNKVEGSKEVFKKVSNAYSTLIDADKRASYDRYGPEESVQAAQQQHYSNQRQQFHNQDQDFENLFRQFFGGGTVFFQPQRQHYRMNTEQHRQRQQVGMTNMKWMFLVLALLIFIPKLFERKPEFQVNFNPEYANQRSTSILKNRYFVRSDFQADMKGKPNRILQIEKEVDYQNLVKIISHCQNAKRIKQNYNQNAAMSIFQSSQTHYTKLANSVDLSPCTRLHDLQTKHPQYITQLIYLK